MSKILNLKIFIAILFFSIITSCGKNDHSSNKIINNPSPEDMAKDILTFDFLTLENLSYLSEDVVGTVNGATVSMVMPYGTTLTSLVPNITINGSSVSPLDGVEQDFSSPVVYTVTAADSSTKEYTVTVIYDPSGNVTNYTTGGGTAFNMVAVKAGLEFKQGIDDAGDISIGTAPATATVDNAFEIGQTEVTYELWYEVRVWGESNGYTFVNLGREGNDGIDGNPPTTAKLEPVTTVNWRDTIVWCNALTEYYNAIQGQSLECVYTSDVDYSTPLRNLTGTNNFSVDSTPGSLDYPYVNPDAKGFRLPTTTEWGAAARWEGDTPQSADAYEYPASSGQWWTAGDYASGAVDGDYRTDANNDPYAWYPFNADEASHDVGTKIVNALGLYDMSGSVLEWNFEWHPYYIGFYHVIRGGNWYDISSFLQVGYWDFDDPYTPSDDAGFRFVRTL